MTVDQLLATASQVSGLLFVLSSMAAMGMSLLVSQIVAPLRDLRRVALALVASFVLVPALAVILSSVLGLEPALKTGLLLLATAAGAPFLPKLVQGAKGDVAFGVGLMVLLMVVTIGYMPAVLPLLLPDVSVDPWAIAQNLIVVMAIPLVLGLLVRAHLPEDAATLGPQLNKLSGLMLLVLLVTALAVNLQAILALVGTRGIAALLLFVLGSLAIGMVLGGKDAASRTVMGLGTAQRNIAAAILVAAQNFAGTPTVSFVLVGAIVLLLVLLPVARRIGAASGTGDGAATTPGA